jgi:hypothetical protein
MGTPVTCPTLLSVIVEALRRSRRVGSIPGTWG